MLAAAKRIVVSDFEFRRGIWGHLGEPRWSLDLKGKTLLFLGFGRIAQNVAQMLTGFEMKYLAIKRNPDRVDDEWKKKLVGIGGPDKLHEFLEKADFVLMSLPLTPETENFLDEEAFNHFKKDAVLVNIGRGKTINEKALFEALLEKKLGAAAIDSWYQYPPWRRDIPRMGHPSQYPFEALENVVMSPHRAWLTKKCRLETWAEVIENLKRYLSGKPLINIVDLKRGY